MQDREKRAGNATGVVLSLEHLSVHKVNLKLFEVEKLYSSNKNTKII